MKDNLKISAAMTRLVRLDAAKSHGDGLNPVQLSALLYLRDANRFSRSPSHVAEYLGTTRGTMSQTLKTLQKKGFVIEATHQKDKRSVILELTEEGRRAAANYGFLYDALETLEAPLKQSLLEALSDLMKTVARDSNSKAFGICRACFHHSRQEGSPYCVLLAEPLEEEETDLLCHEFLNKDPA